MKTTAFPASTASSAGPLTAQSLKAFSRKVSTLESRGVFPGFMGELWGPVTITFAEASKLLNRKSMENFPYFPFTFLFASHKEIIDVYRESHSAHVASAWNLHTDLVSEYMMGSAFLG